MTWYAFFSVWFLSFTQHAVLKSPYVSEGVSCFFFFFLISPPPPLFMVAFNCWRTFGLISSFWPIWKKKKRAMSIHVYVFAWAYVFFLLGKWIVQYCICIFSKVVIPVDIPISNIGWVLQMPHMLWGRFWVSFKLFTCGNGAGLFLNGTCPFHHSHDTFDV